MVYRRHIFKGQPVRKRKGTSHKHNLPVEKSAKAEAHDEGGEDAAANEDERDLAV